MSARSVRTRHVESRGRRIAYRELGSGPALILCNRFRGVLDDWDPAFLDALSPGFRVVTFDYSGLGQSTGKASYQAEDMARDVLDLVDALGIGEFVSGGWSLGGLAAQVAAVMAPDRVTRIVLIGTSPPGKLDHPMEPVFFEHALEPDLTIEDEIVLFFEPQSAASRAAAHASRERIASRTADRSPPIPPETYTRLLQERQDEAPFPDRGGYARFLANAGIPTLVITGDHEICFPAPNWFALSRTWKSLHLLVLPSMGHAPQHEVPELVAEWITSFVRHRPRLENGPG